MFGKVPRGPPARRNGRNIRRIKGKIGRIMGIGGEQIRVQGPCTGRVIRFAALFFRVVQSAARPAFKMKEQGFRHIKVAIPLLHQVGA